MKNKNFISNSICKPTALKQAKRFIFSSIYFILIIVKIAAKSYYSHWLIGTHFFPFSSFFFFSRKRKDGQWRCKHNVRGKFWFLFSFKIALYWKKISARVKNYQNQNSTRKTTRNKYISIRKLAELNLANTTVTTNQPLKCHFIPRIRQLFVANCSFSSVLN